VILPPDLRKMCGTVASIPAPRNHFWEQVIPSPALGNDFEVWVTSWPALANILILCAGDGITRN
jgi:hypothetical protein